jgi:hypothetical protein
MRRSRCPGWRGTSLSALLAAVLVLVVVLPIGPSHPSVALARAGETAHPDSGAPVPARPAATLTGGSVALAGPPPLAVLLTPNHTSLDPGEHTVITATPQNATNYTWTTIPAGLESSCGVEKKKNNVTVNDTFICLAGAPRKYTVKVQADYTNPISGKWWNLTAETNFSVSSSIGLSYATAPIVGVAPLTVAFNASLTGGWGPYDFSWILGDGSLGQDPNNGSSHAWINHTYTSAGTYQIDLWGNDSTSYFDPVNGSTARVITVVVSAPPPKKGPFGLPDPYGYLALGAIIAAAALLLAIWFLYGDRSRRLPPPESWMIPPEELPESPTPPPWPPPSS